MRISESEYKKLMKPQKARTSKPPRLTENQIQTQIRKQLEAAGWFVIRHQQGLGSMKGLSDLTALKGGQTVYIEVKTPRGVLSEYQAEFQRQIECHGGTYIVARDVRDIDFLCPGISSAF